MKSLETVISPKNAYDAFQELSHNGVLAFAQRSNFLRNNHTSKVKTVMIFDLNGDFSVTT